VQALLFLYNAHPRSCTIGSIARRLSVTPATATRLVDALERKGLVRRVRLEEDRRTVRVEPTEEGRKVVGEIADIGEELERLVRILPEGEQEALAKGLKEVLKAMQQAGYVTASGTCRGCSFFQPEAYPGEKRPHYCALTGERLSEEESYLERLDWVGTAIP
jgi:DNA-binding MarR family transcriptional regulator